MAREAFTAYLLLLLNTTMCKHVLTYHKLQITTAGGLLEQDMAMAGAQLWRRIPQVQIEHAVIFHPWLPCAPELAGPLSQYLHSVPYLCQASCIVMLSTRKNGYKTSVPNLSMDVSLSVCYRRQLCREADNRAIQV